MKRTSQPSGIEPQTGRKRARRLYIKVEMPIECEAEGCNLPPYDRHHVDGDTGRNDRSNILFLCRSCHGFAHSNGICKRGHLLSGDNLRIGRGGTRFCRTCHAIGVACRRNPNLDPDTYQPKRMPQRARKT